MYLELIKSSNLMKSLSKFNDVEKLVDLVKFVSGCPIC